MQMVKLSEFKSTTSQLEKKLSALQFIRSNDPFQIVASGQNDQSLISEPCSTDEIAIRLSVGFIS